jgi:hypothetical protein
VRADHRRRRIHVTHRDDDAEHGGDDADAGERVADDLQQPGREVTFRLDGVELCFEQLLEVIGGDAVDDLLQRLGEERRRVMLLVHARILLEDVRLRRLVDVRFEGEHALASREHEHLVLALQQIEVVALLRDVLLQRELHDALDARLHLSRCRGHQRTRGGAEDDDELRGLDEDGERPACHREPTADG